MARNAKLLARLLDPKQNRNCRFDELLSLVRELGFEERIRGSHHIFHRAGIPILINLQREGSLAKAYQVRQVRQVRNVVVRFGLVGPRAVEDS